MRCSLLDITDEGPSAAAGRSCRREDINRGWLKCVCRPSCSPLPVWASSPSASLCSSVWRSSWGAPRWPPPQDRAVAVPEPSEDISPLRSPGWTHWDHYWPTGKDSYEDIITNRSHQMAHFWTYYPQSTLEVTQIHAVVPRRSAGAQGRCPAPHSDSDSGSSLEAERRVCRDVKHWNRKAQLQQQTQLYNDWETQPHPWRMTWAAAATSSSYSTTSLSELFTFLLQQKKHVHGPKWSHTDWNIRKGKVAVGPWTLKGAHLRIWSSNTTVLSVSSSLGTVKRRPAHNYEKTIKSTDQFGGWRLIDTF